MPATGHSLLWSPPLGTALVRTGGLRTRCIYDKISMKRKNAIMKASRQEVDAMGRMIYACDVGSIPRRRFAWARVNPELTPPYVEAHDNIDCLIELIAEDIKNGISIALGFESPLFLPEPLTAVDLFHGREVEGRWAWCGQPGLTVTAQGIHLSAWILRALRHRCGEGCLFTLDPNDWPPRGGQCRLFLWEAFVAGSAHGPRAEPESHKRDAATAANFFRLHEDGLADLPHLLAANPINLAAAVALWSGWLPAADLARMHQPMLVVRPQEPCKLQLHDPPC